MSTVKDVSQVAMFAAILFIQEAILYYVPNVQLTFLLIIFFSVKLTLPKTILIILIHTTLDNLFLGPFNIIYYIFMLIGYLIIPLSIKTIFKKARSTISLSLLSILYSFLYSYCFVLANIIIANVDIVAYIIADIPFELILALSSFLSVIILYNPLSKFYDKLYK